MKFRRLLICLLWLPLAGLTMARATAGEYTTFIVDIKTGKPIDTLDFALAPSGFFGRYLRFTNILVENTTVHNANFDVFHQGKRVATVSTLIPEKNLKLKKQLYLKCAAEPDVQYCRGDFKGRWDAAGWLWGADFKSSGN